MTELEYQSHVTCVLLTFQQSTKTKSAAEELELTVLRVSHSLNELRKEVRSLSRSLML